MAGVSDAPASGKSATDTLNMDTLPRAGRIHAPIVPAGDIALPDLDFSAGP